MFFVILFVRLCVCEYFVVNIMFVHVGSSLLLSFFSFRFVLIFLLLIFVVSTGASDCLEIVVSEMTCNVLSPSNSIWPYLSSDLVRSEREYC